MSRTQYLLVIGALLAVASNARGQPVALPSNTTLSQTVNAEEIPLRSSPEQGGTAVENRPAPTTGRTMTTIVGALAICLGAFFLFVWVTKRSSPAGLSALPKEVLESLGRTSLHGRQHLQLLRVGRKLVLLYVTPTSAEALTEIIDPVEVDRLIGLCQQASANSVTTSFRDVLTHFEKAPAEKGFLGEATKSDWELATRSGRKRPAGREELDA